VEEERVAARILALCKEAKLEPPLVAPSSRPETKVVALALAMFFWRGICELNEGKG